MKSELESGMTVGCSMVVAGQGCGAGPRRGRRWRGAPRNARAVADRSERSTLVLFE